MRALLAVLVLAVGCDDGGSAAPYKAEVEPAPDLAALTARVDAQDARIAALEQLVTDQAEELEARVSELEGRVSLLEVLIDKIVDFVGALPNGLGKRFNY